MGCHTWYKVPVAKGRDAVTVKVREELESLRKKDWWDEDCEREAKECERALKEWDTDVLEDCITNYYFYTVKGVPMLFKHYEHDSDEPRIGGYPENVITSEKEMLEFIKTGFTREDGKHFDFYIEEERRERVFKHIKKFFELHPDGIITFG
jgi:hypothetical protein